LTNFYDIEIERLRSFRQSQENYWGRQTMNFHLLHHRKLSEVLSVPEGLQELMADIAREVLRYQPANIECFIADYLESMLMAREMMYVADRTIDDILSNSIQVEQLVHAAGISVAEAIEVVKVTEEEFRKKNLDKIKEEEVIKVVIERCKLKVEQARKIAGIIENSWKYFLKQNLNKSRCLRVNPYVLKPSPAKNTLLYHHKHSCQKKVPPQQEQQQQQLIRDETQKRENAAAVIQSWYRRKKQERDEIENAALTIQAALRGFTTRKELMKLHNSARVIQQAFLGHRMRKEWKQKD
jgi:hypothetical protein